MAATLLGSLLVSLGLDSAEFKSGLNAAEKQLRASTKRIEAVGQSMVGLGSRMSLAVTVPLIALGKSAVTAAMESQDAIGQVNVALKSMGNAAGRTSEQLQGLAKGQMRKSLYDDDEILRKVTANLLTFGNIAGAQFDKAQQAALDLSARLGQDLQSSTIQIGKALNDPIKGITALQRVGVSFTAQQKEQIQTMAEAGNVAGAQTMILAELEKQFGGAAEAARKSDPFAAMTQSWNEFQEQVGGELLKAMPAITGAITALLEAFNSLSPGMQKIVVVGGVVLAVLGPVLVVLGSLVTVAAPLIAAFGLIAGAIGGLSGILVAAGAAFSGLIVAMAPILVPLALIVAAVLAAYLAWKNWDKIKAFVMDVARAVGDFWNGKVKPVLLAMVNFLKTIVVAWFNLQVGVLKAVAALVNGVKTWIQGKLRAVFDWLKEKLIAVGKWFYTLYNDVVGNSYIPDMVDGIASEMKRLDNVMVKQAEKATKKTADAFRKLAEEVRPILDRLFPEDARRNTFDAEFAKVEAAGKAKALSVGATRSTIDALINEFLANRPEPEVPAIVLRFETDEAIHSIEGINVALEDLARRTVPTQSRMEAFFTSLDTSSREVFENLSQELSRVILGFQSLGDALRNVVARLADKALNALFNMGFQALGIPGFAGGTMSAPRGLALVGERGPELVRFRGGEQVIPNHELGGLGGRQEVHKPTFVFPGITNERMAREAAGQAARRYRSEINGPMRRM